MTLPTFGAIGSASTPFVIDTHANRLVATPTAGQLWKESDTNLIYLYDGSAWQIFKADGAVRKTADETVNNSNTPQNDDHLLFPIEANEVWGFGLRLICTAPSTASDYLAQWSLPSGAAIKWSAGVNGTVTVGSTPTGAGSTQVNWGSGAGSTFLALIEGIITNSSTVGTAQFQWSQNTATVEDSKILTNSYLQLRRLA